MRVAIKEHRPWAGKDLGYKMTDWAQLEADSRGAQPNPVDKQLKAAKCTQLQTTPSLIEEPNLHGELRKVALRWSIYSFPVQYAPTEEQQRRLELIPQWQSLEAEQQKSR